MFQFGSDAAKQSPQFVPELDWDHTKFREHFLRGSPTSANPTARDKVYDFGLKSVVLSALAVGLLCTALGTFSVMKIRSQRKHVTSWAERAPLPPGGGP